VVPTEIVNAVRRSWGSYTAQSKMTFAPRRTQTWRIAARPTVVFVAAYMLTLTPHEIVHAVVAHLFGFSSTIFQLWVNPDTANAAPAQVATIALAGPSFNLLVGMACWALYRRRPDEPSALIFLMLATMGTYAFLGSLAGAAFGGDAYTALQALRIPEALRYAVSLAGALGLASFMFFRGADLMREAPLGASRPQAVILTTVAPWIVGTALALLLYLPLPAALIISTVTGSAFWLFAALGAALKRTSPKQVDAGFPIRPMDLALAAVAVLIVRVLASGIRLES
jgi:hypothetical protein